MHNCSEMQVKKIIHIDMDSFFASVEIRDKLELASKPVAVGGLAEHRGVIATSNYIARKYGVHSAMSTSKELTICPNLVVIKPNIEKYNEVSQKINKIFYEFTDQIEPVSIDESYLDVTNCKGFNGSATKIAIEIKKLIYQQEKLTASAGVSINKFLTKIASDWNKPDGLFVLSPGKVNSFVKNLSLTKIPGVGKVTAKRLAELGFFTYGELQSCSLEELRKHFGKFSYKLYSFVRGIDCREIVTSRIRKSLSV
jgi:DNA polymerase-4